MADSYNSVTRRNQRPDMSAVRMKEIVLRAFILLAVAAVSGGGLLLGITVLSSGASSKLIHETETSQHDVSTNSGLSLQPASSIMPVRGVQSVTARVSGRFRPKLKWSVSGGKVSEAGDVAWFTATAPGRYILTALDPELPQLSATATIDVTASPVPVTTHPRLWFTGKEVTQLRSWAAPTNPTWGQALLPAYETANSRVQAHWSWKSKGGTGTPDSTWADPGTNAWVAQPTEAYAEFYAFMSLVHPEAKEREASALKARDMLMWVINQAAMGPAKGRPFRDNAFALFDRSRYWGEAFPLTVDWIYPYLSPEDKRAIQKVFLRWSDEIVHAAVAGNEHPEPVGVVNSPALLSDTKQLRWSANNYFSGHMRNLTLFSLALDAPDDPPRNSALPVSQLGNSMRSYIADSTGAWLYQQYATFEDPRVVSAVYKIAPTGLGSASGGAVAEGMEYGTTLSYILQGLLALRSSGHDDPATVGPQVALENSSYWDRFAEAFSASLAPRPSVPISYLGTVYPYAGYGDLAKTYADNSWAQLFATLGVLDRKNGNEQRLHLDRWVLVNALPGGANTFFKRAGQFWGDADVSTALLQFMLFQPNTVEPPVDPRSRYPTEFYDLSLGRVLARSDWGPNASWFTWKCSWNTINHQNGDGNQFEFYRNGEWLIKERSGYGNDYLSTVSEFHNTLTLQNDPLNSPEEYEIPVARLGGQWTNGTNAGDPLIRASARPSYVFALGDSTNLYNHPHQWVAGKNLMQIVQASRSILWLRPDSIFVYDRAASKREGLFKRFNLVLTGRSSVEGRSVFMSTASGQHLRIDSLLPHPMRLRIAPAQKFKTVAEVEPTTTSLTIEDPTNPAEIRFLHVLQASDRDSRTPGAATVVHSSAGTPFDGAVVRSDAVLFIRNPKDTAGFANTTFAVPASTSRYFVTGLKPGNRYSVGIRRTPGSVLDVTVSVAGELTADEAGVIVFSQTGGADVSFGNN